VKILTFTALFPNNVRPRQGVFVSERMSQVARLADCEVRVVAPVPWYPPIRGTHRSQFRQVVRQERVAGLDVTHPRYAMMPKVGMTTYGLTMFLSVASHVRRIQREFDFDLIDAHFLQPDGLAAVWLGRLCRRPVVVSARGSDVNVYGGMPLIRPLLRYTLRHADGVIAVSGALKRRMVELGSPAERIAVIPNGVDVEKFSRVDPAEARSMLGLPTGRLVLAVGGLVPIKGFDLLIEAVSGLPDISLVLVGNGPAKAALRAQARRAGMESRVRFAGEIAHEQLHLWYSAADVLCLPSRQEGCPNVVLEALSCGTPVVASAVGGLPEIIISDHLGLLCDGRPGPLRDTLRRALALRWDAGAISAHTRQRHGWARAAADVVQVFRCVAGCSMTVAAGPDSTIDSALATTGERR
jgi:glycosyltransferase involved in cell wall biosynthesis